MIDLTNDEIDAFFNKNLYIIKCYSIIEAIDNSSIQFFLKCHGDYYKFSYYFNEKNTFADMLKFHDKDEVEFDIYTKSNFYKIPANMQNLTNVQFSNPDIICDLFQLNHEYEISEVLNEMVSCLNIDSKYKLQEDHYIDIKKELRDNDEEKEISR